MWDLGTKAAAESGFDGLEEAVDDDDGDGEAESNLGSGGATPDSRSVVFFVSLVLFGVIPLSFVWSLAFLASCWLLLLLMILLLFSFS